MKLLALVLSIGNIFLKVFVMSRVWEYTCVPLGAPMLTMWQVFGIAVFIRTATLGYVEYEEKSWEKHFHENASTIVALLVTWGLAYLLFGGSK